jgi:hypothetical protein
MPAIVPVQNSEQAGLALRPEDAIAKPRGPDPGKCHPERSEGSLPAGAPNTASGNFNDDTGLTRGHSFAVSRRQVPCADRPGYASVGCRHPQDTDLRK